VIDFRNNIQASSSSNSSATIQQKIKYYLQQTRLSICRMR